MKKKLEKLEEQAAKMSPVLKYQAGAVIGSLLELIGDLIEEVEKLKIPAAPEKGNNDGE